MINKVCKEFKVAYLVYLCLCNKDFVENLIKKKEEIALLA